MRGGGSTNPVAQLTRLSPSYLLFNLIHTIVLYQYFLGRCLTIELIFNTATCCQIKYTSPSTSVAKVNAI